jgi:metal-responsive CopG/Arc/MetJ family transcriptional regulator
MNKRTTIYLDPALHRALRMKAAETATTLSELINDAVREALREDEEDLRAFAERAAEPTMSYEAMLKDLKKHGGL